MRVVPYILLLIICTSFCKRNSLFTHSWKIHYNDSLLYSSRADDYPNGGQPKLKDWMLFEMELNPISVKATDSISITYFSCTNLANVPMIIVKGENDRQKMRFEGKNYFNVQRVLNAFPNDDLIRVFYTDKRPNTNGVVETWREKGLLDKKGNYKMELYLMELLHIKVK